MELKNVIIYFPDHSNMYYEIGMKMKNKITNEEMTCEKITEDSGKIIVILSNKEEYLYSLPYSSKLN